MEKNLSKATKIGIFDSGVGGLTLVKALNQKKFNAHLVYLADTEYLPYGEKTPEEIQHRLNKAILFFLKKQVSHIAIACHTACVCTLEKLQEKYPDVVLGITSSALEKALLLPIDAHVLLIGTSRTISSGYYEKKLKNHFSNGSIQSIACPLFTTIAETTTSSLDLVKAASNEYFSPFLIQKRTHVLYVCSHFPVIHEEIKKTLPKSCSYIDPAEHFADRIMNSLPSTDHFEEEYFSTKNSAEFHLKASRILGRQIQFCESISL